MRRFVRAAGLISLALFATASVPSDVVLVLGEEGAIGYRADTTAWLPNPLISADEAFVAGLDFAPDGNIVTVPYGESDIYAFSGEDGAFIGTLNAFPGEITATHVGASGTLYGADSEGLIHGYDFVLDAFNPVHSFDAPVEALAEYGNLLYALVAGNGPLEPGQIAVVDPVLAVQSTFYPIELLGFANVGFELQLDPLGRAFLAPQHIDPLIGEEMNWVVGVDAAGVEMWRVPTPFLYVDALEIAADGSLWVSGTFADPILGGDIHAIDRYDADTGLYLNNVRTGADPVYPSSMLSGPGGYGPEPAVGAGGWPGFTLPPGAGGDGGAGSVPNDVILVGSASSAYIEGFDLTGSAWPNSPFLTNHVNTFILNPVVRDMEWDADGNLLVLFNGQPEFGDIDGGDLNGFGGGSEVARFNGITGEFMETLASIEPFDPFEQIHTAIGLEVAGDGSIYVAMDKRGVYKIDPNGPPFPTFEFHFATGNDSLPAYWGADMTDFQIHGTDAIGIFAATGMSLVVDRTPLAQDGAGTRYTEADVTNALDFRHNTLVVADDGSFWITYRDDVLGEEVLRNVSATGVAGAQIPLGPAIVNAYATEFVDDAQTELWMTAEVGDLGPVVLTVNTITADIGVAVNTGQLDQPTVQPLLRGNAEPEDDTPIIDNCPQNDQKLEPEICGCWYYDIPVPEELDGGTACQHITATVDNDTVDLLDMVYVEAYANVESDTFVDKRSIIFEYAHVGERTTIGHDSLLLRRSYVGDDVQLGNDNIIGRLAEIGDDSVLLDGVLVGYSSHLGPLTNAADFTVVGAHVDGALGGIALGGGLGTPVVVGSRVEMDPGTTIGQGTVIGPDTVFTGVASVGTNARVRKQSTIVGPSDIAANARIGRSVQLLGANTIGDNARVGAEAVVPALECVAEDAHVRRGEQVEVGQFTCPVDL